MLRIAIYGAIGFIFFYFLFGSTYQVFTNMNSLANGSLTNDTSKLNDGNYQGTVNRVAWAYNNVPYIFAAMIVGMILLAAIRIVFESEILGEEERFG